MVYEQCHRSFRSLFQVLFNWVIWRYTFCNLFGFNNTLQVDIETNTAKSVIAPWALIGWKKQMLFLPIQPIVELFGEAFLSITICNVLRLTGRPKYQKISLITVTHRGNIPKKIILTKKLVARRFSGWLFERANQYKIMSLAFSMFLRCPGFSHLTKRCKVHCGERKNKFLAQAVSAMIEPYIPLVNLGSRPFCLPIFLHCSDQLSSCWNGSAFSLKQLDFWTMVP